MDANYHLYVMELVKAYNQLATKVEELEAKVAELQGKKKCRIVPFKAKGQMRAQS